MNSTLPASYDPYLIELAAELLRRPSALADLQADEAHVVVSYMRLWQCDEGAVLLREGEQADTGHMLLVIDGEVSVENTVVSRTDPLIVTVLGPGSLIGEMGLLDGAPRAASCIAMTPVQAASLSRGALRRLMSDEPAVAAKLLANISQGMAQRLREAGRQQRVYSQLVRAMQEEINELNHQLQQVMDGALNRAARQSEED
ncbi:MAG TPA: cyclic nucleotide-binding domain-containing protein [Ideonella sp.]|uniref:cyclic nucleotide-binding domain-containing protein n=1 Tax=Ideonella sp. TaxID=1929293 RepID=UPI002D08467C|nr:cyclic nucleotide-binding domain-containing protein [Ideonella sp.]HSI50753.1 cyclic nucleotide-binding domain-containing protein [Ideonella sp.]